MDVEGGLVVGVESPHHLGEPGGAHGEGGWEETPSTDSAVGLGEVGEGPLPQLLRVMDLVGGDRCCQCYPAHGLCY